MRSLLFAASLFAQTPAPAPRFEIASIKPNVSNASYSRANSERGNLFIENNTLLTSVRQAGVRAFAIMAPAWHSGERFDITAKFPESGAPR